MGCCSENSLEGVGEEAGKTVRRLLLSQRVGDANTDQDGAGRWWDRLDMPDSMGRAKTTAKE